MDWEKVFLAIVKFHKMSQMSHQMSWRVPGLPIRDCARGCNNRGYRWLQLSTIHVIAKTFFERLYLVLGLGTSGPWVNCPYAPTTPTVHTPTILDFRENLFPERPFNFFCQQDSPSNLAESWYPPPVTCSVRKMDYGLWTRVVRVPYILTYLKVQGSWNYLP